MIVSLLSRPFIVLNRCLGRQDNLHKLIALELTNQLMYTLYYCSWRRPESMTPDSPIAYFHLWQGRLGSLIFSLRKPKRRQWKTSSPPQKKNNYGNVQLERKATITYILKGHSTQRVLQGMPPFFFFFYPMLPYTHSQTHMISRIIRHCQYFIQWLAYRIINFDCIILFILPC